VVSSSTSSEKESVGVSSSVTLEEVSSKPETTQVGIWVGVSVAVVVLMIGIVIVAVIAKSKSKKGEQDGSSDIEFAETVGEKTDPSLVSTQVTYFSSLGETRMEPAVPSLSNGNVPQTSPASKKEDQEASESDQEEEDDEDEDDDSDDEEDNAKKLKPFRLTADDASLNDEWSKLLPGKLTYEWKNSPVSLIPLTKKTETKAEEFLESHNGKDVIDYGETLLKGESPKLYFGSRGTQVPVDHDIKQKIILAARDSHRYSFKIIKREYPKYEVSSNPLKGTLSKSKTAAEVTITLRMRCTTSVELNIPVVFWRGSMKDYDKMVVKGEVEDISNVFVCYLNAKIQSQLSTRLDIEDLVLYKPAIGCGAFGTVYKGEYRGLDIACKVLKNQDCMTDEEYESFDREVNMFETLRHPCIVNFVGAVYIPGSLALVTELCKYGALPSAMEKYGPEVWNSQLKIKALYDCAHAMVFLHKSSIIHRDLKPDNLLVTSLDVNSSAMCKLSDFGTTKGANGMMENMTMTKGIGTPLYMAPELMKGSNHYTMKADVYSFGIMIASVIDDGKDPYENDSRVETSWQFANLVIGGMRPEVKKEKEMPSELITLMKKCWDDKPDVRPGFDEIVHDLESLLK